MEPSARGYGTSKVRVGTTKILTSKTLLAGKTRCQFIFVWITCRCSHNLGFKRAYQRHQDTLPREGMRFFLADAPPWRTCWHPACLPLPGLSRLLWDVLWKLCLKAQLVALCLKHCTQTASSSPEYHVGSLTRRKRINGVKNQWRLNFVLKLKWSMTSSLWYPSLTEKRHGIRLFFYFSYASPSDGLFCSSCFISCLFTNKAEEKESMGKWENVYIRTLEGAMIW